MSSTYSAHQLEQLLNSVKNGNVYFKNFDLTLHTISYLLKDSNNEKAIVVYINKLLKCQDEEDIYVYLTKVISTISTETLNENILHWLQQIIDRKKTVVNPQRYAIISKLVQFGASNQDFNKLITSTYLFKLIDECISINIESIHIENTLHCLTMLLETYPNSCSSKRTNIESYLIQFLFFKSSKIGIIKNAALCFQKLHRIGAPGIDSINYKNNWKAAFERLCVTLDILYDNFFDDVNEVYDYEKLSLTPYTLPALPKVISATETLYVLENRLHHTCMFLRGMLENEFCCVKPISPGYLLDIITRALSYHVCIDKSETDTNFHFAVLLIKNQICILYLLRSLIALLQLNLLPVSAIISKLLIDCLAKTQNCNCFNHINEYKETLCEVLEYWISTLKNCFNRNLHDKLLSLIANDISSIVGDISLNLSNTSTDFVKKGKNKSVNPKIISNSVNKSTIESCLRHPLKGKDVLCYQSLCFLITLLTNADVCITKATFNSLYTILIKAIASVNNGEQKYPYNTINVRKKLFEALLCLIECSHMPVSSISSIINLLNKGEHCIDESISISCSKSLHVIEKICQPICPSLYFPDKNNTSLIMGEKYFDLDTINTNDITTDVNSQIVEDAKLSEQLEKIALQTNPKETIINSEHRHTVNIENEAMETNCNGQKRMMDCKSISEDIMLSRPDPELITHAVQEEIFINQEHFEFISDVEDNHVEPVRKKPKADIAVEPNINAMLLSFVDEVSTNVEKCITTA